MLANRMTELSRLGRAAVVLVALATVARAAAAQEVGDDEVERRLQFLESRLKAEASQARWYEAGWSAVYVGGLGFGAYQVAQAGDKGALTEGIVGASKSLIGATTRILLPLKALRSLRELDDGAPLGSSAREQRLALAESLLLRNVKEADVRYKWQPHVISLALNLVGGAIVWLAGDFRHAAQSTGIAIAVGELAIWTQPWGATRHLREYKRQFGGLAASTPSRRSEVAVRPSLRASVSGLQVAF